MTAHLQAGIARADITPPLGIGHAGWGAQAHQRAAGVDLPLWVTALAIGDGQTTTLIVDIDCMYLFETEAAAVRREIVRRTGLPDANVRISYTHTHSGPISGATWSAWMPEAADLVPAYDARIAAEAGGAAWAALRAMRPARLAAGRGSAAINVNRRYRRPGDGAVVVGRNPAGPVDREVQVIRIDTLDGAPLATIVNYACHPITVGPDNDLITPDYPGVTKRVVEDATGSTCLFLQGAAGDLGPVRGVARDGLHEYRRLGAILGHEASRMWWELELPARTARYAGTLESGAPLAIYAEESLPDPPRPVRVLRRVLELPTRPVGDLAPLEAKLQASLAALDRARALDDDAAIREATMNAKRAGMRAGLARRLEGRETWPVEVHAIALGDDLALIGMAAEPFAAIGMAIKARSPFAHTLVSGYTGVGWAYLPTSDAYPSGGYEVEVTPFAAGAAELAIAGCLEMLTALKGDAG